MRSVFSGCSSGKLVKSLCALPLAASLLAGCGRARNPLDDSDPDGHSGGSGSESGGSGGLAQGGMTATGGKTATIGDPPSPCRVPVTSQLPRLTNAQYDGTVRDLLGVTALSAFNGKPPSALLVPDHRGELTAEDWAAYMASAEAIAAQVMKTPEQRSRFLTCTPVADGSACLHDTIVSFGRRAFRRPLTEQEVARFDKIVAQREQITISGTVDEIAEVLLQAFLVAPSFLQRAEISEAPDSEGRFVLSGFEVAARLSYLLWQSPPDDALTKAADANALLTADQIRGQAQRMLRDERAHEFVKGFHRFYLDSTTPRVATKKDPKLFPGVDDATLSAINEESARFFDAIVFERPGTFQDLLTSPRGFVNAKTAPLYGLDPAKFGAELEPVTLDTAQRPGFLTRLGFLAAYAHEDRTAPILRGAFIVKDVLGVKVPPPDPKAIGTPLPQGPEFHTNRERVTAQTAGKSCNSCHALINPLGFVLEAYDAVGAFQTVEADTGAAIDTSAEVSLGNDVRVKVNNPQELMKQLASSLAAQQTYAKRWVSYAYDHADTPEDICTVDILSSRISTGEYPILDLIVDLTQQNSFRMRTRGPR